MKILHMCTNAYLLKEKIYNHIRMVDGGDYKKAYINFGDYKIEFYDSNLENNAGKTIFVKGHPITLKKCIAGGKYTTVSGSRINLKQLIKSGKLNACILNGVVARRYESTLMGASPMP